MRLYCQLPILACNRLAWCMCYTSIRYMHVTELHCSSTAAGYIVAFELQPGATLGDLQALVVQELQKQETQVRPQPEPSANRTELAASSALHSPLHRVQACLFYSRTATPGRTAMCCTCYTSQWRATTMAAAMHALLTAGLGVPSGPASMITSPAAAAQHLSPCISSHKHVMHCC